MFSQISVADVYTNTKDYGKSLLGSVNSINTTTKPQTIAGFKGTDDQGLDDPDVLERKAPIAMKDGTGGFVLKQFNRENRITLSNEDELIVTADKLTKDPVKTVAKAFKGEVKQIKSKKLETFQCEESGEPYLVACKYLLKPVPYYGEKDCEEQHERAIETCKKELEVKPIYENKTCEQKVSIIRKAITTLQEKHHQKVNTPIIERVYKADIKYVDHRHTPYKLRGKPHWTHDAYIATKIVQDGTRMERRRRNFMSWIMTEVLNYKTVEVWNWQDRVVGYQMQHPSVSVIHAEYREVPVFGDVQVLHKSKWHSAVHERRVLRWDKVLTKSRVVNVPSSIFHWVGGDIAISGVTCIRQSERCIDTSNKNLYGTTVSQPCWRKEITYSCSINTSKNNCESLRKQGCSQIKSTCLTRHGHDCLNYLHTMSCFKEFQDIWAGCESFKSRMDFCNLVSNVCSKGKETRIIAGRDVSRDCWQRTLSHACAYPALNNCEQLRLPSCKQVKETCLKIVNDTCVVMGRRYRCVDGVNDGWESNCKDLELKALQGICERVTHKAQDKSTKAVDGFDHTAVWEKTNIFRCQYIARNNCSILKARKCRETNKACSKKISNTCVVWQKTFTCGLQIEKKLQITKTPRCLDGNCRGEDDINDGNIAESVAQLSVLKELSKDMDKQSPSSPSIFKGDGMKCRYNPLDFSNCCKLRGWGNTLGLAGCNSAEKQLSHFRSKKYCVPIGTYCHKYAPLKAWCRQKRQSYCCFKGKLQRILQVEAHKQLGINWGNAKSPNCQGLTPEQLQRVDFSKLNLSEVYQDVLSSYKNPNVNKIQQSLKNQLVTAVNKGSYSKEPPAQND